MRTEALKSRIFTAVADSLTQATHLLCRLLLLEVHGRPQIDVVVAVEADDARRIARAELAVTAVAQQLLPAAGSYGYLTAATRLTARVSQRQQWLDSSTCPA